MYFLLSAHFAGLVIFLCYGLHLIYPFCFVMYGLELGLVLSKFPKTGQLACPVYIEKRRNPIGFRRFYKSVTH